MNHRLFPEPIDVNGYQTLLGSCSDMELLRVGTGNLVRRYTVAQVATVGPALNFELAHNSRDNILGSLGPGWRHNWMAHLELGTSVATYEDARGRRHVYKLSGGDWVLDQQDSLFVRKTLTKVSDQWHLKGFADGDDMIFDSAGNLLQVVDSHGQALTLHYLGSRLTAVEEPTGRQLTFSYSGDRLSSVVDPRGNVTRFVYGTGAKLKSIVGPEGCLLSYDYASGPSNGLIVGRTDARNNHYSYSYDGNGRLLSVTNPAGQTLTYTYGSVNERLSSPHSAEFISLDRTVLRDAEAKDWDYRFDKAGNLWRILDPLTHNRRFYWSDQQELLYVSEGYGLNLANELGPLDSPYNRFSRFTYDGLGNQTSYTDANGIITQKEYDADNRLVTVTPARATTQIGGDWFEHFGKDGFVICSALDESSDLVQLPPYIASSGILPGEALDDSNSFVRYLPPMVAHRIDPRVPLIRQPGSPTRDTYRRTLGMWKTQEDSKSFTFRIPIQETGAFNLSFYTHATDQDFVVSPSPGFEKTYAGLFGRDVEILVTDFHPVSGDLRRQVYRHPNNGAGCWITFGVYAEAESFIRVLVRTRANISPTEFPCINMIAFDPIEQRTTNLYYTGVDLTQVVNGLEESTSFEYNLDGTLKKVTDAKSRDTQFFYEDPAKNLTKITDAYGENVLLTYDANGNVTSSQDQDGRTSSLVYDAKNRLIQSTDPLLHSTAFTFDGAGNLLRVVDAKGRKTQLVYDQLNRLVGVSDAMNRETFFEYSATGRLTKVTDALGRESRFVYDAAGRLVETEMADGQKVLYALNAVNRLVSITGPNANQSDWDKINLNGALEVLTNGGAEAADSGGHPLGWRYTYESLTVRTNAESHSGNYSLPIEMSWGYIPQNMGWHVYDVSAYAGGRYLAKAWAKKGAGGAATVTATIAAEVRNFQAALENQTEPQGTEVGTEWTEIKPQVVQIPGDTQSVRTQPALSKLKFLVDKSSPGDVDSIAYVDDASLQLLNTCMEYDGENLRQVSTADGARFRREFDRVGRLCKLSDPQGRVISMNYDSLDRVVSVSDSLGLTLAYAYDATGQLVSFTDARNQVMEFAYDDLDRLITITYPDESTEKFAYSPAGDLLNYTDNHGQERIFDYDQAHRLTGVTYPNSDVLVLAYDEVNNLISRTERNGDVETYFYDKLNRVTRCVLTPGVASASPGWDLTSTFDEVGKRTKLANTGGVRYDESALYHTDHYGQNTPIWSVPEEGFDEMNRLVAFQDSEENGTTFGYDIEGRRTSISCPNGTLTEATYDIVGKLLSLRTSRGEKELLKLDYDYNLAGDRLGQQTDKATYTYHLDKSGRLVEETINRWVTSQPEHLAQGLLDNCQLDPANSRVQLLGISDTFQTLNLDRWKPNMSVGRAPTNPLESTYLGNEMRVSEGIHMIYPSTWSATQYSYIPDPVWYGVGMGPPLRCRVGYMGFVTQKLDLRRPLVGDFDLVLEFDGFDMPDGLRSGDPHFDEYPVYQTLILTLWRDSGQPAFLGRAFQSHISTPYYPYSPPDNNYFRWSYDGNYETNVAAAPGESGKIRVARTGSTLTLYYWSEEDGDWTACSTTASTNFPQDLSMEIKGYCEYGCMNHRVVSLTHLGVDPVLFPEEGTYESLLFDAGKAVPWKRLSWVEELEGNTDVEFQLAFSNDVNGPWSYIGPDGTAGSWFTTSAGETLPGTAAFQGRYARFQAKLSSDGMATPKFGDVHLSFGAAGMLSSSVRNYQYDEAGNITMVTKVTDSGSVSDVRNHNDVNQITDQVVGTDAWVFSYDDNGNMTGKTNGTETWTYVWNDENRLIQVTGEGVQMGYGRARYGDDPYGGSLGSVSVDYTYDSMGRMLTRDDGTDLTTFTWDHWDCVKEVTGESETVYHIPDGVMKSFTRDGVTYQVHFDALGTIRMVTDDNGDVVLRRNYDAWGSELPGGFDSVPGGMPYGFVGAYGCRKEPSTSLVYMRQRWYDPTIQRFISRDPIGLEGGLNTYAYASNDPANSVDPTGLDPIVGNRRANILDAIDLVRRVDQNAANDLRKLLDENKLQLGNVKKMTGGAGIALTLRMIERIYLDPDLVADCPTSNSDILFLASILVHELDHYKNQDHPILRWIYSAANTAPRELQQVQAQRDFVNKLLRSGHLDSASQTYARDTLQRSLDNQIDNLQNHGRYNVPNIPLSDPPRMVELLP